MVKVFQLEVAYLHVIAMSTDAIAMTLATPGHPYNGRMIRFPENDRRKECWLEG